MALEEDNLPQRPHRKRRLRWGRLVFFIVLLAAVVTAGFWGAVWCYDNLIAPPKVDIVGADSKITADETLNSRINVLLLGIDDGDSEAAESEPKRTDAMMLASFDPEGNEVALVSMPRDTMVQIPGHKGYDKINAAYAYGGVMLAKQTVANLLRVPIHYYVLVDWRAFKESIDLIGGVDLYVDKDMYYEDPYADLVIDIKPGYQHLNGELAGQYVRFRKDELGDIGRVQRQQKFMMALAAQIFNIDTVTKIPALFSTVDRHVETDMDTMTMIKAANTFKLFGDQNLKSCMLYGDFYDAPDGISYWRTSQQQVERTLDELGIPYMKDEGETESRTADNAGQAEENIKNNDNTAKEAEQ